MKFLTFLNAYEKARAEMNPADMPKYKKRCRQMTKFRNRFVKMYMQLKYPDYGQRVIIQGNTIKTDSPIEGIRLKT